MSLAEIGEVQREVDAFDDQIRARIREIAEALRAHVSIELIYKVDEDATLVFGKVNGKWTFLVENADGIGEPIDSCPRHVRAEMIPAIEKLIDSALEQLRSERVKRVAAIADADRILERLK